MCNCASIAGSMLINLKIIISNDQISVACNTTNLFSLNYQVSVYYFYLNCLFVWLIWVCTCYLEYVVVGVCLLTNI